MSYAERSGRRPRPRTMFAYLPAAEVPEGLAEVGRFGDLLGGWLVSLGGRVGSVGYDLKKGLAEMVIETPGGPRLEITVGILAEGATIEGDCQGCGAENAQIILIMRGDRPVYLCRECYR